MQRTEMDDLLVGMRNINVSRTRVCKTFIIHLRADPKRHTNLL